MTGDGAAFRVFAPHRGVDDASPASMEHDMASRHSAWARPGAAWLERLPLGAQLLIPTATLLAGTAAAAGPGGGAWTAGAATLCALGCYGMACVGQVQGRALAELRDAMQAVVRGDLTRVETVADDTPTGRLGRGIEQVTQTLSRMVARVRSEAQLIAMASEQLTHQAGSLSQRTDEQSRSLVEAAHNLQQVLGSVKDNSAAIQAADTLAGEVRHAADHGAQGVAGAVSSMQDLDRRSSQMTDIIGVIDGIAFQTNILALNAAVEAARAGESGRGFAVVATEVRVLAQRSAQAAAEVKKLIEGNAGDIRTGVEQIQASSASLGSVVQGIAAVAERLRSVNGSSSHQSAALDGIAGVVQSLERLTQDNAHMAETAASAAQRLQRQASGLSDSVSGMKLRQGCADEARALVEKAAALLGRAGLHEARQRFHDRTGGFIDRDMFIIVLDRANCFRAFGVDPTKADKPAVAAPGVDIDQLCADTWAAADAGGGWVEFCSLHPVTKLPAQKVGYVRGVGADYAVLASVNKTDGTETQAAVRTATAG
jgi:methyl-accepting chemotaxis protein